LHVDLPVTVAECSSRNRRTGVEVDVNDRVNLYVAVKLKVWVDVEVLVEGPRSNHDRPEALGSTRLEVLSVTGADRVLQTVSTSDLGYRM